MEDRPSADEVLLIGTVVDAFGLHGEIKVRSVTDRVDHLRHHVQTVFVGEERRPFPLQRIREPKTGVLILTLGGVTDRTMAEALRGAEVTIRECDAAPLEADEYFIHQLYGLRVVESSGAEIGIVREVLQTGANDVIVVERHGRSDTLLPMIHDVVESLDVAAGQIVVRLLPGLIDEEG
ncbi:MAG: 16S rRNA processing protein RimM [Roseiflexus castenholzii]|jgi:16S rRNA processing protein RimM|uniref:Ribosome maturation factor RimM n=1 Tax=Roseiflexus castenholzii (strain DSM 13941 / HLO8) TaxID=383372 RepID=RIMM_ROSCS|nr:ribosome maturation factor RimM [Roseiflexus castenholzii]A7NJT6.1 RecName: Full=Ribosome maturation factor RimM [Roseiflexus castenholzii DSM 13941]ABU57756.1 16S rRNA processing protein RimM [Roseiflexus castenholzii DSM 13941]PMP73550.1 MAG: 16S rRNA processing protein RimM [Roseiflexus castenholzii]